MGAISPGTRRVPKTLLLAVLCLSSVAAAAQDAGTAIGKERANASGVEWDVKDVTHPKLGAIRFASRKVALATPVGNDKIVSQAYVSCQKSVGRIAIELSNAAMSNLAGGLSPKEMPRLTCYSPNPRGGGLAMAARSSSSRVMPVAERRASTSARTAVGSPPARLMPRAARISAW